MLRSCARAHRLLPRLAQQQARLATVTSPVTPTPTPTPAPQTHSARSTQPHPPPPSAPSPPPPPPPSTSAPDSQAGTGRPRRPRPPAALLVTPAAEERIRALLAAREPRPVGVRIGLRTRGCNGMAYVLNYADTPSKFDEAVHIDGGSVFIDPRALMHIVGTTMDFVDNDLVSEFVFQNPNAKGMCGCGESFNV